MNLNKLIRADFGSDWPLQSEYNLKEKLVGYLTLVRPIFVFMTPFNAASAAVLSISRYPSWKLCLGGFLTAAFASAGVNIFNRFADRERDKIAWPWRAIPSGRVKAGQALALTILLFLVSLALCWFYFNPVTFFILLIGIILGSLYSSYLRDKVGYLSLPPIEGLIFLAGWAALSPGTIFSLTPWILYLIGLSWQAAHIMGHYLLHVRYDSNGNAIIKTPAFLGRPSPEIATLMAMGFLVVSFLLSLWLIQITKLNYIYLVLLLAIGVYALYRTWILVKDSKNKEKLHKAWSSITLFRKVSAIAILISIFIYQL
jgi:4-hydroxybenzoate polyprenyltransferase